MRTPVLCNSESSMATQKGASAGNSARTARRMTAKTAAAGQRWREKRRYSADQSWNSSPQVVNKPVTVWRPKQSKLLQREGFGARGDALLVEAGRHWLQSCWKARGCRRSFF